MDMFLMILCSIIALAVSIACIIGSIIIYKVYVSTCSFSEFMEMIKTQGYLKALFRFDKLVSPKILEFLYGLQALGILGAAVIVLVVSIIYGITQFELLVILGGIFGSIILVVVGEIFVRIGYEIALLFFKMNESLTVLKEAEVARSTGGDVDDRSAGEALADSFNSFKNSVMGQQSAQSAASMMKFCPNCGTQNKQAAKFCKGCGTAI